MYRYRVTRRQVTLGEGTWVGGGGLKGGLGVLVYSSYQSMGCGINGGRFPHHQCNVQLFAAHYFHHLGPALSHALVLMCNTEGVRAHGRTCARARRARGREARLGAEGGLRKGRGGKGERKVAVPIAGPTAYYVNLYFTVVKLIFGPILTIFK